MKLSIDTHLLQNSIKTVSRIVSNNNTLPVLGNILLRAESGVLECVATNLTESMISVAPASVKDEGSITVPARLFTAYISLLKSDSEVELSVSGTTLTIKTGDSITEIKGIDATEFPRIDVPEKGNKALIPSKEFHDMVSEVAFSVDSKSLRRQLTGIFTKINKDNITFAATDSYRLSEKVITMKNTSEQKAIIPVRAFQEADKSLASSDNVELIITDNQAVFKTAGVIIITQLISGEYPDYHKIIPKEHPNSVELSREELDMMTKRVSLIARENAYQARFELTNDGTVKLYTDMNQAGKAESVVSGSNMKGSETAVGMNMSYLQDCLNSLSNYDTLVFSMGNKGEMKAVVVKPKDTDGLIQLIMPLKM